MSEGSTNDSGLGMFKPVFLLHKNGVISVHGIASVQPSDGLSSAKGCSVHMIGGHEIKLKISWDVVRNALVQAHELEGGFINLEIV